MPHSSTCSPLLQPCVVSMQHQADNSSQYRRRYIHSQSGITASRRGNIVCASSNASYPAFLKTLRTLKIDRTFLFDRNLECDAKAERDGSRASQIKDIGACCGAFRLTSISQHYSMGNLVLDVPISFSIHTFGVLPQLRPSAVSASATIKTRSHSLYSAMCYLQRLPKARWSWNEAAPLLGSFPHDPPRCCSGPAVSIPRIKASFWVPGFKMGRPRYGYHPFQ